MSASELTMPPAACAQVRASGGMALPISDGGAPAMSKYPDGIRPASDAGQV